MKFTVLTIFPEMFDSFLGTSLMLRARKKKIVDVNIVNIRDFSKDKHKKVDDTPYGGGAGMLMTCQPIFDAVESWKKKSKAKRKKLIYLTPQGKRLTQARVEKLSQLDEVALLCGHYEGIDQRVRDELVDEEISIGDYVLSGGELPAMVLVEAVSRMIPNFVGKEESYLYDSFSKEFKRKKEHPHYTKPANFRGLEVPGVLTSGDHKKIEAWRKKHLR